MVKMNQEYLEFVKALRPIDDIFMKVIFNDQHCIELLFNIIFKRIFPLQNGIFRMNTEIFMVEQLLWI